MKILYTKYVFKFKIIKLICEMNNLVYLPEEQSSEFSNKRNQIVFIDNLNNRPDSI